MRLTALRRFLAAVAMVPLLAGLAFAATPRMFVCSGDSIARAECCCSGEHDGASRGSTRPTIAAGCCCDISQMKVPTPPGVAANRAAALRVAIAFLAVRETTLVSLFPRGLSPEGARLAQGPPGPIPIRLAKQSFQI